MRFGVPRVFFRSDFDGTPESLLHALRDRETLSLRSGLHCTWMPIFASK